MTNRSAAVLFAAATLAAGSAAFAQVRTVDIPTPTLDRWVYTFGSQAGAETEATVFSILGSGYENTFDIRDGQFLVGYTTAPAIPAGLPAANYRILSASLVARISRDKVFRYDPTFDAIGTYLSPSDPAYTPDTDTGNPVELYAVGYRNGLTSATFAENTPFAFGNPAQKSVRNAYAAQYSGAGGTGSLIDVSNNILDLPGQPRFEARPLAIGAAPLAPGALVDVNTDFTFTIDPASPDAARYLRESLAAGRLNLMISSMAPTSIQSSTTPAFWTKEAPSSLGAAPASLHLRVCVGAPGDWNCSGDKSVQDIFDFLTDYFTGQADFNNDGSTSVQDIFDFLAAWFG